MSADDIESFDRIYGHVLSGIIASTPGGVASNKTPNWFTDFAATITLAAIKSRGAAMDQLRKDSPGKVTIVATEDVRAVPQGSYTGPITPSVATFPQAPQAPQGALIGGPTGPAPAAAGVTPADRTARLVGTPPDVCPVCKGPKTEASRTMDAQCPHFHFQPHGSLTPPQAASTPATPPGPIVTGPTPPIHTG